jgi:hypothetical protein
LEFWLQAIAKVNKSIADIQGLLSSDTVKQGKLLTKKRSLCGAVRYADANTPYIMGDRNLEKAIAKFKTEISYDLTNLRRSRFRNTW